MSQTNNKIFISKSLLFLLILLSTFFVKTSFSQTLDKTSVKLLSETFTFSLTDVRMKNIDLEPTKISQKLSFNGDMLELIKTIDDDQYIYKIKLSNLNPEHRSFTYNDNFIPKWYLLKYWLLEGVEVIKIKNGKQSKYRTREIQLSYYGESLDTFKILFAFQKLIDQCKSNQGSK